MFDSNITAIHVTDDDNFVTRLPIALLAMLVVLMGEYKGLAKDSLSIKVSSRLSTGYGQARIAYELVTNFNNIATLKIIRNFGDVFTYDVDTILAANFLGEEFGLWDDKIRHIKSVRAISRDMSLLEAKVLVEFLQVLRKFNPYK